MRTRKEMKRQARQSLKHHYLLFVAVCLLAAFLGSEFAGSLSAVKSMAEGESLEDTTGASNHQGLMDVIEIMLVQGEEQGRELSEQIKEEEILQAEGEPALGRTRGILANLVNDYTSGSFAVSILSALTEATGSQVISRAVFVILSLAFLFLVWFFIQDVYQVIARRILLEARVYEQVPIHRFLYLVRVRKWVKTAVSLLVLQLLKFLWMFTVIGYIIKRYSYYMVPYILAENPNIGALEAVNLSRRMMKGHKWQCFVFELSYIGWDLLGIFTLGITGIFYSNPYQAAAFCEYYAEIRREAKEKGIPGAEALNDRYLYEKARKRDLTAAYGDVDRRAQEEVPARGVRGFLASVFGITLYSRQEEMEYEEKAMESIRGRAAADALEGKIYPGRLFPIPEYERRKWVENLNYMRRYSPTSLILLYFIFCFIGWIFEVSQGLVMSGEFIKRGVLHGPWLPIYGTGGILILVVLYRLRKSPIWEFLAAVVLCGSVEYLTGLSLELTHDGMKWWDYSGYFLNIQGRVCAEGLLAFGVMGLIIVYVVAPMLDNFLKKIPLKIAAVICGILLAVFCGDQLYSVKHPNTGHGITDIGEASLVEEKEDLSC